jgi:hypothetical protein
VTDHESDKAARVMLTRGLFFFFLSGLRFVCGAGIGLILTIRDYLLRAALIEDLNSRRGAGLPMVVCAVAVTGKPDCGHVFAPSAGKVSDRGLSML